MDIDLNILAENIGLKFDEQVILGLESVSKFIKSHSDRFQDLELSRIDESHMLYGYNSQGNPVKIGFNDEGIERIVLLTDPITQRRLKVTMAYDGHKYSGFQIQDNNPTVQGALTEIISDINGSETVINGCSRTDTGVHANNYVFHFDSERDITEDRWKELLNYRLPEDIYVKEVGIVHPLFHSRYDVHNKRYIYKINIGARDPFKVNYEWTVANLDLAKIESNLPLLLGTHDFSSFCKGSPEDSVRTLMKAKMKVKNDEVTLIFEGDGFLRYMIRIIVYALVEIGRGKLEKNITELLEERSRESTKHMAPAAGLYLDKITY